METEVGGCGMSGLVARGVERSLGFRGERSGIQWLRAENFGSGVQGPGSLHRTFVAVTCDHKAYDRGYGGCSKSHAQDFEARAKNPTP